MYARAIQQCEPCRELPHDPARCLGLEQAGCTCRWCPGRWRQIITDAQALRAPTPTEDRLLRIAEVKYSREIKARAYRRWQPICAAAGCGRQVGALRFGRMRKFCSRACRERSYRQARRERLAEQKAAAERARLAAAELGWLEDGLGTAEQPEPVSSPTARERRRWTDNRIRREPLT
jgi:hypothetical protein